MLCGEYQINNWSDALAAIVIPQLSERGLELEDLHSLLLLAPRAATGAVAGGESIRQGEQGIITANCLPLPYPFRS